MTKTIKDSYDHIRTWESDGFKLELYDTYQTTSYGKPKLAYRLWDGDRLIFEGDEYGCAPGQSIDGDESTAGLLAFLSLKPGDTDHDYFDDYTPEQMEWCQSGRAEQLGLLQVELEERARRRRAYEDQVRHPGKFEGEAPWVPYYWESYLDGCYSDDDGDVVWFDVGDDDRTLFSDLEGVDRVGLRETDTGFVVQV